MKRHFRILVLLFVLFLLTGCVLNEMFAITPREGETQEEFDERQEAGRNKAAAVNVLLGVLGVLYPAGLGALGVGVVLLRKYRPYLRMLKAIIGAIEDGAPKKAAEEPVKAAVMALHNPALNKLVYDETHH